MKLLDCWGAKLLSVGKETKWCANREKEAYLVEIGGGYHDMPYFYDLWWKGHIVRLEVSRRAKSNTEGGVDIIWYIHRIPIPKKIWMRRKEVLEMISQAFCVNRVWYSAREVKSIEVKLRCEAEKAEGR